jgi:hypothetical protein
MEDATWIRSGERGISIAIRVEERTDVAGHIGDEGVQRPRCLNDDRSLCPESSAALALTRTFHRRGQRSPDRLRKADRREEEDNDAEGDRELGVGDLGECAAEEATQ